MFDLSLSSDISLSKSSKTTWFAIIASLVSLNVFGEQYEMVPPGQFFEIFNEGEIIEFKNEGKSPYDEAYKKAIKICNGHHKNFANLEFVEHAITTNQICDEQDLISPPFISAEEAKKYGFVLSACFCAIWFASGVCTTYCPSSYQPVITDINGCAEAGIFVSLFCDRPIDFYHHCKGWLKNKSSAKDHKKNVRLKEIVTEVTELKNEDAPCYSSQNIELDEEPKEVSPLYIKSLRCY